MLSLLSSFFFIDVVVIGVVVFVIDVVVVVVVVTIRNSNLIYLRGFFSNIQWFIHLKPQFLHNIMSLFTIKTLLLLIRIKKYSQLKMVDELPKMKGKR